MLAGAPGRADVLPWPLPALAESLRVLLESPGAMYAGSPLFKSWLNWNEALLFFKPFLCVSETNLFSRDSVSRRADVFVCVFACVHTIWV